MSVITETEEQAPKCPRCGSDDTIFYGKARTAGANDKRKARCHSCTRFWTIGGKLR